MSDLDRLRDLEARKLDVIEGTTSDFIRLLSRSLKRLNSRIPVMMRDLTLQQGNIVANEINLARAINARAQIEEILLESGFRENANRLIRAYDEVAKIDRELLDIGGVDSPFTRSDISAITAIKELDMGRWDRLGNEITEIIHSQLMDSVVSGANFQNMVDSVQNILIGLEEKESLILTRAKTLANTLLQSFDRVLTNRKARQANVETFIYLGPLDQITREFCERVLSGDGDSDFAIPAKSGNPPIYTLDEINGMDNGQGLPVSQFGGGFNCRHKFRPIVPEEVGGLR